MAASSRGLPGASRSHAESSAGASAGSAVEALMRASRVVTAAIVRSLGAVDDSISVTQLRTLVLVDGQGPMTVTAVADALGVNASNASRTCDRLVTAGLLDRRAAEDDRRRVALTLTEQGHAIVEEVMDRRGSELAAVVARMEPSDRAELARALGRFARAAEAVPDGAAGEEHLIAWLS